MLNRCKHKWEVLSETVTESHIEQLRRINATFNSHDSSSKIFLERKHIQVFTCAQCGAFKRFVEDI